MKTRLIVFARTAPSTPAASVLFAVPEAGALTTDLGDASLGAFASACGLTRHEAFDWAAGDAGARCALLEVPAAPEAAGLPTSLPWPEGGATPLRWLSFPMAARALLDGTDRRYLQLAVQYVSSGGVDENVIAADTGGGLLGQLASALESEDKGTGSAKGKP